MKKRLLCLSLIVAMSLAAALLRSAVAAGQPNPVARTIACPPDYRATLHSIRGPNYLAERKLVTTTYANAKALQVTDPAQLPYANGSVFLFEYAEPVWDENGSPRRDSEGALLKGRVVRLDVMERGSGYGEMYGADRAGEWEFASFQPDGTDLLQASPDTPVSPTPAAKCAACHLKAESRDYVFAGRFSLFTGEK